MSSNIDKFLQENIADISKRNAQLGRLIAKLNLKSGDADKLQMILDKELGETHDSIERNVAPRI